MLNFVFLFLIFLIFFLFLLLIFSHHYQLTFNYSDNLNLNFFFSLLFIKIKLKASDEGKEFYLQIFKFKIPLSFTDEHFKIGAQSKSIFSNFSSDKSSFKLTHFINLVNKEYLNHLFKFFKSIISELKPNFFSLNLLLSFADPYYNGLFVGYYEMLRGMTNCSNIKVAVNWQEACFQGDGKIAGRIVPIKILFIFLKFIFSLKSLKLFWQLYKSN